MSRICGWCEDMSLVEELNWQLVWKSELYNSKFEWKFGCKSIRTAVCVIRVFPCVHDALKACTICYYDLIFTVLFKVLLKTEKMKDVEDFEIHHSRWRSVQAFSHDIHWSRKQVLGGCWRRRSTLIRSCHHEGPLPERAGAHVCIRSARWGLRSTRTLPRTQLGSRKALKKTGQKSNIKKELEPQ